MDPAAAVARATSAPRRDAGVTACELAVRSALAILQRPRACTVEAGRPSSIIKIVFAKAVRISFAPLFASQPSATPALRARKRCTVSLSMPDLDTSVRTAAAEGAKAHHVPAHLLRQGPRPVQHRRLAGPGIALLAAQQRNVLAGERQCLLAARRAAGPRP